MAQQIDTKLWNMADMLAKLGFEAEEHGRTQYDERWYTRPIDGGAVNSDKIRVVIHPDDGHTTYVYCLDRHEVMQWDARFNGSTPLAVIRASVRAMVSPNRSER